jgi:ribosomal protein L11 methylase PrmA
MKTFQKAHWTRFADKISGSRDKAHHKWEQCIDEAKYYIDALIPHKESAVLLDPMCGSGTNILAGLELGVNQAIGIDTDSTAFATTQARVDDLVKKIAA